MEEKGKYAIVRESTNKGEMIYEKRDDITGADFGSEWLWDSTAG